MKPWAWEEVLRLSRCEWQSAKCTAQSDFIIGAQLTIHALHEEVILENAPTQSRSKRMTPIYTSYIHMHTYIYIYTLICILECSCGTSVHPSGPLPQLVFHHLPAPQLPGSAWITYPNSWTVAPTTKWVESISTATKWQASRKLLPLLRSLP